VGQLPTASELLTLEPTVNNDARLATQQATVTGMLEDIVPGSCKDNKFVALTELQSELFSSQIFAFALSNLDPLLCSRATIP
jgi:hypothetical protein